MRKSIYERWAEKVRVEAGPLDTPCWMWTSGLLDNGYGRLKVGLDTVRAHRLSWELNVGPIPAGMHVLHKCDLEEGIIYRRCVCPAHLFVGTHQENMADMMSKGRCSFQKEPLRANGEKNVNAVLTNEYVREARALKKTSRQVVAETGVGRGAAWNMLTGRTWKHVAA